MVSTDDREIKAVALSRAGTAVDDRAIALAGDKIKVVDVIGELLDRPEVQKSFDVVGMLLPTCPFRTPAQVAEVFGEGDGARGDRAREPGDKRRPAAEKSRERAVGLAQEDV